MPENPSYNQDNQDSLKDLLCDLNTPGKRGVAERTAANLPPELLLELARLEADSFRQCQQQARNITLIVMGTMLPFGLIRFFLGRVDGMILIAATALALVLWLVRSTPSRAHNSMIRLITGMKDPRSLGPILTLLMPDRVLGSTEQEYPTTPHSDSLKRPIVAACKSLLRTVRADHEVLLTREQMRFLLELLKAPYYGDVGLQLAILKALEQIGDETAVPIVAQIAETRQWRDVHTVRAAARECLPFLRLRAQQQQAAQTLLRASANSETVIPEMLLRPATATSAECAPEQLLRPQG